MRVLITAGPTREPIDPVRYLGNRSSGKMGAAIAQAALAGAHEVTLVLGPVAVSFPPGARRVDVETAAQMHATVMREFPSHDLLIMAAAVVWGFLQAFDVMPLVPAYWLPVVWVVAQGLPAIVNKLFGQP